jgi:hypothetical protein
MIGNKIKVSGRTIQFFRNVNREAAENLGYRAGETKDVPSMKLTILIVCTLLLWPSGRALCQANRENSPECALAERALAAYQEIKPGHYTEGNREELRLRRWHPFP